MKKIVVFVLVLAALLLAACAAPADAAVQTSSAVQVPAALVDALAGVTFIAVLAGLQLVFELFGVNLTGLAATIATALSAAIVAQLQGLIDIVPAQYDSFVGIALQIAVVILGGLGFFRVLTNPKRAAALFLNSKNAAFMK